MIYQETLKLLKKASDPYTIDEPKGWSPSAIATRYWLNNDPKIVDQRDRLNALRSQDNAAIAKGDQIRAKINAQSRADSQQFVRNAKGSGELYGKPLTPKRVQEHRTWLNNLYSNDFDEFMGNTYAMSNAIGQKPRIAPNIRSMLLMRQNPAHGLNFFKQQQNQPYLEYYQPYWLDNKQ